MSNITLTKANVTEQLDAAMTKYVNMTNIPSDEILNLALDLRNTTDSPEMLVLCEHMATMCMSRTLISQTEFQDFALDARNIAL